jgi:LPXTG-motif cell wall-anchored protein
VKFDKLDKYVPANKLTDPQDDVEWKYYVKETTVPGGYSLQYGDENGNASASKLLASEGETVINSLVKVALPDTGGSGTLIYSMLGMMLIALAGTAYMILLRRRKASLKGGGNPR